jgi:uncharacterized protein involved in exopolysaccharide biosynthesis
MARARYVSPVGRLSGLLRRRSSNASDSEIRRLEEKYKTAAAATQQWLSLLREMERNGETDEVRYEQYYRAYLQSKQLEKRTDLHLFNLREGLTG